MVTDVTELVMLRYHYNENEKRIKLLQQENDEFLAKLVRKCTHPTTVTTREYSPGGYDYVSSVTVTTKCNLCDTVLYCYDDPNHKGTHG
jgi:hypothetical protein